MRSLKLVVLVLLLVGVMFAAALPSFAEPSATITGLSVDTVNCTLTVTIQVGDAGTYYVQIWDDGANEGAAGAAIAAGGTASFTFTIGPIGTGAPGIGVIVSDNPTTIPPIFDVEDPYNPDFGSCSGGSWSPVVAGNADCPNPIPAGFVVRSIPAGALTYFKASSDAYTGFNLPAGQTWYTGTAEDGFVEVWIACQANNVFVPADNVVG